MGPPQGLYVIEPDTLGVTHDDITSLGPLFQKQPGTGPFFLTPQTTFMQREARVGFDGSNYLVVWCENHYTQGDWLMGCRVSPQGDVLDPGGFLICQWGEHLKPRLAAGRDAKTGRPVFLVVWTDRSGPSARVRGALVRTTGKPEVVGHVRTGTQNGVLTGAKAATGYGFPIFPDIDDHFNPWMEFKANWDYDYPDVAFNGTEFVVTAVVGYQIVARPVSTEGYGVTVEQPARPNVVYPWGKPVTIKLFDAAPVAVPGYFPKWTRIASRGGPHLLVTWSALVGPELGRLYGARLSFGGSGWQVGGAKEISGTAEPGYGYCALDSDGQGGYLLAWHDMCQAARKKTQPWQVAWPDLARAAVKPVPGQPTGCTVEGWTLMVEANQVDYYPEVGYDGKNYLITWGGYTSDLAHFHPALRCQVAIMFGAYVTPDSTLLDAFYIKPEDGGSAQLGAVCFGAGEGLLVYEHIDPDKWNLDSHRKLRLRFVARTT